MQCRAAGAIMDLVPALGAIGGDQRVGFRLAHSRQQRQFAHLERYLDCGGVVAERNRHAAAVRFHRFDGKLRDELKRALDRAHGREGLLMAVAVQQRLLRERRERQVQPPLLLFARKKFLEQQRVLRQRVSGTVRCTTECCRNCL